MVGSKIQENLPKHALHDLLGGGFNSKLPFFKEVAYCKAHHVWSIHSSICLYCRWFLSDSFFLPWSSRKLSNSMNTFQCGWNHEPAICFFAFTIVYHHQVTIWEKIFFLFKHQIYAVWQVDAYDSLFPTHMTLLLEIHQIEPDNFHIFEILLTVNGRNP